MAKDGAFVARQASESSFISHTEQLNVGDDGKMRCERG
jgi:hypothetical protein